VLLVTSGLHACNDALFYVLYPLLPFIASEFGMSYAEVGLLNAVFTGSSALLQLPAGLLGERVGEYGLLVWGNGWVAVGLGAMAIAGSFQILLAAAVLAGLGGNFQHPLASALVARAYEGRRRGRAIGTLNFAGDVGKLATPALVALVTVAVGWRVTLASLAIVGIIFSLATGGLRSWVRPPGRTLQHGAPRVRSSLRLPRSYAVLTAVGMLDATTRTAALTFLPFVLVGRGLSLGEIGLVFGVVFASGAVGKFACGVLGDRLGTFAVVLVTEATTALALVGLVWGPANAPVVFCLAAALGFGLNGTSSVLYAAVAGLVPDGNRGGGYGLYYTATQTAAALAALGYGLVADRFGLNWTFAAMAALTLAVVPLAVPIRRQLAT
jgi:MFS transporter, FSR family, fosmidomycin resistance protein